MTYDRRLDSARAFYTNNLDSVPVFSMSSGNYYRTPACTLQASTTGTNVLRVVPKFIPNAVTLTRLGAEVTTIGDAGSKIRLGIYADDGTFRPGSLVIDAGQIAGDSATVQEITISQSLTRGWYWFGGVVQSVSVTQPTMRCLQNFFEFDGVDYGTSVGGLVTFPNYGFQNTGISGSLPGTFTISNIAGSGIATFVKVA